MANNDINEIQKKLEEVLPPACELSKVEFEGPDVAIYLKNITAFYSDENLIRKIASSLRKRVLVRADGSTLVPQEKARKEVEALIPVEAGVQNIQFMEDFCEVAIESLKPGLVIGKQGSTLKNIILKTGWSPKILRTPTMPSETIKGIRGSLYKESENRKKFLNALGKKISTASSKSDWVKVTALGGFREVGRSCLLVQTPNDKILIDCGVNPETNEGTRAFPYLTAMNIPLDELDAVIVTHAHLDHCLEPDTLVAMADGTSKPIDEVVEGDVLASVDLKTGRMAEGKCTGKIRTRAHESIVEIRTENETLRASPNHRFFVVEGMQFKEIEADSLKQGDVVAVPCIEHASLPAARLLEKPNYEEIVEIPFELKKAIGSFRSERGLSSQQMSTLINRSGNYVQQLETMHDHANTTTLKQLAEITGVDKTMVKETIFPVELNPELAQIAGYVTGDGHASSDYSVRATDKNVECLEEYKNAVMHVFSHKAVIRHHPDRTKNAHVLEVNNAGIKRFLELNFEGIFAPSNEKRVPRKILSAEKAVIAAYLRGLADAEGSVTTHIKIASSSNKLLEQAQTLFRMLGITATIADNVVKIEAKASMKRYAELVGFSHPLKAAKLAEMTRSQTAGEEREITPINAEDARSMLTECGFISRARRTGGSMKSLPPAIHELCYYGKHATRKTAMQLAQTLESKAKTAESARKQASLKEKRRAAGLTIAEVCESARCTRVQAWYREKENLKDKLWEKLNAFLDSALEKKAAKCKETAEKIKRLLAMPIKWHAIKKIEKKQNDCDYLVDIEVEPHHNFIANGLMVHNSGFIPYLYAYGYDGPVYCTAPTRDLMALLQFDYIEVVSKSGGKAPYNEKHVRKMLNRCVVREYEEVTDITPETKLTLHNAGHILGSSMVHLHISEGLHNLVISGDIKYGYTQLFEPANTKFPRIETLFMESTYGGREDIMPQRHETDSRLAAAIMQTLANKGKVLIPVFSVGRSQEIMLVLEEFASKHPDFNYPIYSDGMILEASAIHTAYPEYLKHNVQRRVLSNNSPFESKIFEAVKKNRKDIVEGDPCVIIAPSGMMSGGPSIEYFKMMAENPNNLLVFVGYQSVLSMGRKLQRGLKEVPIMGEDGRINTLKINMKIETVDGFSGHSDRAQLISFMKHIRPTPERIFTGHGEETKCEELARVINRITHLETRAPMNLDSIRLK